MCIGLPLPPAPPPPVPLARTPSHMPDPLSALPTYAPHPPNSPASSLYSGWCPRHLLQMEPTHLRGKVIVNRDREREREREVLPPLPPPHFPLLALDRMITGGVGVCVCVFVCVCVCVCVCGEGRE